MAHVKDTGGPGGSSAPFSKPKKKEKEPKKNKDLSTVANTGSNRLPTAREEARTRTSAQSPIFDSFQQQSAAIQSRTGQGSTSRRSVQNPVLDTFQDRSAAIQAETEAKNQTRTRAFSSAPLRESPLSTFQNRSQPIRTSTQQRNAAQRAAALQSVPEELRPMWASWHSLGERVKDGTATGNERAAYSALGSQLAQIQSSRDTAQGAAYTGGRALAGLWGGLEGLKDAALLTLANTQSRMAAQYSGLPLETVNAFLDAQTEGENESWRSIAARHLAHSAANDYRAALEERYQPGGIAQFTGEAADSIGNMVPSIAANFALPGSGLALLGVSAGGQGAQRAFQEGASLEQAERYGWGSGALEAGTEMMFGGIGGLGRGLADTAAGSLVRKLGQGKAGQVMRALAGNPYVVALAESLGEGVEEIVATVLDPYLQRAIYNPDAENATAEEIAQSAVMGAVVGGLFQAGGMSWNALTDARGRAAQAVQRQANAAVDSAYQDMLQNGMFQNQQARQSVTPILRRAGMASTGQVLTNEAGGLYKNFYGENPLLKTAAQEMAERLESGGMRRLDQAVPGNMLEESRTTELVPQLKTAAEEMAEAQASAESHAPTAQNAQGREIHIEDRTWKDAGSRKVNAFQFDHPELRPYFAEAAQALRADLNDTVRGERFTLLDQEGYSTGVGGTKRMTSEAVAHALDDAKLSYAQIDQALNDLLADHGQENYAAAKKVELVLDEMLAEGYTDIEGNYWEPNQDYIQARDSIKAQIEAEAQAGRLDIPEGPRYDGRNQQDSSQIAEWARGSEVTDPGPAAARARDVSGQYPGSVWVVKDSTIKGRSPTALAVTNNGVTYISDAVPAELADTIGHHEAVHRAKQLGNQDYLDFLEQSRSQLAPQSEEANLLLNTVMDAYFPGRDFFDLTEAEYSTVFDEVNAIVWGVAQSVPDIAASRFSGAFQDYTGYLAQLGRIINNQSTQEGTDYGGRAQADAGGNFGGDSWSQAKNRPEMEGPGIYGESTTADGRAQPAAPRTVSEGEGRTGAGQGSQVDPGPTPEELRMLEAARARTEGTADPTGDKREYRGTPATDKLGIKIERPITGLGAAQSLRGLERARYEAGRALDRLLKQSGADERVLKYADGLVDGSFTMQDVPAELQPLASQIAEATRLRNSLDTQAIQSRKGKVNQVFDERVQELIRNSDDKKVPGTLSLNANTMQRNNVRIWGEDAAAINAELFDPILVNEASRIQFVNRMLEQVEQFHLTAEESALVQQIMEGENPNLAAHAADRARLADAAKTISGLYNDFYEAINDFLVAHGYQEIGFQKDYAPHMQPDNVDTLHKTLSRLGFDTQVNALPSDIAGRTDAFKPGKQYDPYFQHRTGVKKVDDAVGGFESYVNYLSRVLFHTDDIQKLRRFNEGIRVKYSTPELGAELDRLSHLQDRLADGDNGLYEGSDVQALRDQAFARYSTMTKFGDYVSVLDDYTNILAGKQTKLDRAVESLLGRKSLNLGRQIQNTFARSTIVGNLSSALNQTVQLPQVMAEVGPVNVTQAIVDVARGETAKNGWTQDSVFLTGKRGIQSISEKSAFDKVMDLGAKPFEIVDDLASRIIVRAKYLEQIKAGADHKTAMAAADQFANQVVGSRMTGAKPVLFEAKNPLVKLVTTFQLEVANDWAHRTQDIPNELKALAKEQGIPAAAGRLASLFVGGQLAAFLANLLMKSIDGQESVPFDGLGMLANYMASGYGMTKEEYMATLADHAAEAATGNRYLSTAREEMGKFSLSNALDAAGRQAAGWMPYVSNITSLLGISDGRLPLPQLGNDRMGGGLRSMGDALTNRDLTDEERAEAMRQGAERFGHGAALAAASWLPMGNQLRKTAQGGMALVNEGYYTGYGDNQRLNYQVERTPENIAKGLLFGRAALPQADEFYASGRAALGAKQTATYDAVRELGVPSKDAYETMLALRDAEKTEETSRAKVQMDILDQTGWSGEARLQVYYDQIATKDEREALDQLSGADTEALYAAMTGLRRAESSNEKRTALLESTLPEEDKLFLYRQRVLAEEDSKDEAIQAFQDQRLSFDDFLTVQNQYTELNSQEDLDAGQKSTQFAHWLDGQGWTPEQVETVKDQFKYWRQMPAEAANYEKLTRTGLDGGAALALSQALDALEPETGKESVSSLQKMRAIVEQLADEGQATAAMAAYASEAENWKMQAMSEQGAFTPGGYVAFKEALPQFDRDGNGNYTQAEVKAALDSLDLPREEKAALWQMQNTSWKSGKNPYSASVGAKVKDAYDAAKERGARWTPQAVENGQEVASGAKPEGNTAAPAGGGSGGGRSGASRSSGGKTVVGQYVDLSQYLPRYQADGTAAGISYLPTAGDEIGTHFGDSLLWQNLRDLLARFLPRAGEKGEFRYLPRPGQVGRTLAGGNDGRNRPRLRLPGQMKDER